jgi:hypothetical protein
MRDPDGQLGGLGLQHLEGKLASDFLAKPILRLQHRTISPRGQVERKLRNPVGVGGEALSP